MKKSKNIILLFIVFIVAAIVFVFLIQKKNNIETTQPIQSIIKPIRTPNGPTKEDLAWRVSDYIEPDVVTDGILDGNIESIDSQNISIFLFSDDKDNDEEDVDEVGEVEKVIKQFAIDKQTIFLQNLEPIEKEDRISFPVKNITLSEIKKGDSVSISYGKNKDGRIVAITVSKS